MRRIGTPRQMAIRRGSGARPSARGLVVIGRVRSWATLGGLQEEGLTEEGHEEPRARPTGRPANLRPEPIFLGLRWGAIVQGAAPRTFGVSRPPYLEATTASARTDVMLPSSLFASKRERRLWAWTLAVVATIYSTLGLARTLAGSWGDSALGAGLFALCCFMILATVVTRGLRTRPGGAEVGVAVGIAAVYLLVLVRMSGPTERSHLIEYGVVALLIHEALTERVSQGRRVPAAALLAISLAILLGVIDEFIQLYLPSRIFDPVDILFNILAAVMAVAASSALSWARKRRIG